MPRLHKVHLLSTLVVTLKESKSSIPLHSTLMWYEYYGEWMIILSKPKCVISTAFLSSSQTLPSPWPIDANVRPPRILVISLFPSHRPPRSTCIISILHVKKPPRLAERSWDWRLHFGYVAHRVCCILFHEDRNVTQVSTYFINAPNSMPL